MHDDPTILDGNVGGERVVRSCALLAPHRDRLLDHGAEGGAIQGIANEPQSGRNSGAAENADGVERKVGAFFDVHATEDADHQVAVVRGGNEPACPLLGLGGG